MRCQRNAVGLLGNDAMTGEAGDLESPGTDFPDCVIFFSSICLPAFKNGEVKE